MSVKLEDKQAQTSQLLKKYGIVLVLILMLAVLSITLPPFRSSTNIFNILEQTSIFGIMSIGLTFVIISKGIDLSVGSILAFAGVVMAGLAQTADATSKLFPNLPQLPAIVPLLAALLVGLACGLINGSLIAHTGIPAFIATLGMQTAARGGALIFTNGKPVSNLNPSFEYIGGKVGVIPVPVIIYLIVVAIGWVLLNNTRFGKSVYAIGANATAAEISGINVKRTLIKIYAISGVLAGLAAIVFSGRSLSAQPGAATGYELTAIAATTIGGTSHSGGIGTVWGCVVGALVLSVLRNGLTLLGVHAYWQQVVEGAIIIGAVVIDMRKNAVRK